MSACWTFTKQSSSNSNHCASAFDRNLKIVGHPYRPMRQRVIVSKQDQTSISRSNYLVVSLGSDSHGTNHLEALRPGHSNNVASLRNLTPTLGFTMSQIDLNHHRRCRSSFSYLVHQRLTIQRLPDCDDWSDSANFVGLHSTDEMHLKTVTFLVL